MACRRLRPIVTTPGEEILSQSVLCRSPVLAIITYTVPSVRGLSRRVVSAEIRGSNPLGTAIFITPRGVFFDDQTHVEGGRPGHFPAAGRDCTRGLTAILRASGARTAVRASQRGIRWSRAKSREISGEISCGSSGTRSEGFAFRRAASVNTYSKGARFSWLLAGMIGCREMR